MLGGTLRNLVVIALLGLGLAAAAVITVNRSDYRVGLDSLLAIWADFVRDADRIGLVVTRLSTAEETEIGDQMVRDFFSQGTEADPKLVAYVTAVGSHLVAEGGLRRRDIAYRFHVLDISYANAWALPGGHVFITTGLLGMMSSEAQLAAILSHEVAHVDLRHVVERLQYEATLRHLVGDLGAIVKLAYGLVNVAYSSQQEDEADRVGLLTMAAAGYAPTEAIEMFGVMQQAGLGAAIVASRDTGPAAEAARSIAELLRDYFATHPATGDRVVALARLLSENGPAWAGRSFCIGRSSFADRVSCMDERRAAEWQPLDLESPDYHLRLALLIEAAGHETLAQRELATVLAAAPDYAATVRARSRGELDDLPAALTDLRGAVLLEAEHLRQLGGTGDAAALHSTLGLDLALHSALVSMLGRHDYLAVDGALPDLSGVPVVPLCRAALADNLTDWRLDPALAGLVNEARRRGYGPGDCRVALAVLPDRPVSVGRPFSRELRGGM